MGPLRLAIGKQGVWNRGWGASWRRPEGGQSMHQSWARTPRKAPKNRQGSLSRSPMSKTRVMMWRIHHPRPCIKPNTSLGDPCLQRSEAPDEAARTARPLIPALIPRRPTGAPAQPELCLFHALALSSARWPAGSRVGCRDEAVAGLHTPRPDRPDGRGDARQLRPACTGHAQPAARHRLCGLDGHRRGRGLLPSASWCWERRRRRAVLPPQP